MTASKSQADTRARGRARNGTRSGSAMEQAKALLRMDRKDWADIEEYAVHIADFGGMVQQTNTTAAGSITISVAAPLGYAHDALEASIMGRAGAVFFRVYVVPMDSMMRDEPQPDLVFDDSDT